MVGTLARLFGVVFVVVGVLGFVPSLTPDGNLLGMFPVNTLHNLAHVLLGLWGLMAGGSGAGAVGYFKALAIIYGLLAILGLIPATQDFFGLIPLHGGDVWLHAVLALVAAIIGFGVKPKAAA
jgi:hypothetical protein